MRAEMLAEVERPELRIISDELRNAAHARREAREGGQLRAADGKLDGHPSASPYLLTKFSRSGVSGGALFVKRNPPKLGGTATASYKCEAARSGRCPNTAGLPMLETDAAVLGLIEREILQADAIERTLDAEVADSANLEAERGRVLAEVAALDLEIARLVDLAAQGSTAILAGSRERESPKAELTAQAEHLDGRTRAAQIDREALRATVTDWREKLSRNPTVARQVLTKILSERLSFVPDGRGGGSFGGSVSFGAIMVGVFTASGRENRAPRNPS